MADIVKRVAELVRETRKEKGLTQKELGKKLGVSESTVNGYESGKFNITVEKLETIFKAMDYKIEVIKTA